MNWVGIYNLLAFVGSELALFLFCRPLQEYWVVPTAIGMSEGSFFWDQLLICLLEQCSTYQYALTVNACLSIPGDVAILVRFPQTAAICGRYTRYP